MRMANSCTSLLFVVIAVIVVLTGAAHAETVNCSPITSLPANINTQGIHCLTGNLDTAITNGNAITIATNNVVLDLNGFKLGGLGGGTATTANGIFALQRQNITVKNGTIRGFAIGIQFDGSNSQGLVIEDIRADNNRSNGFQVAGTGNIVRNNQVVTTGGWTAFANADAVAIVIAGSGARVLNNDVIQVTPAGTGAATGILLVSATGALVVNNRITSVRNNDVFAHVGTGIEFAGAAPGSTGKYRDNVTFDVTTPYTGGTDIGNNN